jgi:hypothetical protein
MMSPHGEFVVALFNVLGFGDLIKRFPLEEIHEKYRRLLAIVSSKSSHAFLDARPAGDGTSVPFLGYVEIEHDYFSDTILLWTHSNPATLTYFLHTCARFMCEALQAELPLRGAVTLGTAIMDKSERTYLGPPIDEAARAEKAQQWIGLSFGRSFKSRRDLPFRADLVRPYERHRKPGASDVVAELVVDWPRIWREKHNTSAVPILERLALCGKAPEYYRCTIEFVRYSDASPEWWKTYSPSATR